MPRVETVQALEGERLPSALGQDVTRPLSAVKGTRGGRFGVLLSGKTYSVGLLMTRLLNVHPDSQEFSCVIAINTFLLTDVVLQSGNGPLRSKPDAVLIVLPFVAHVAGVSLPASLAGFEDPALCPFLLRGYCSLLSLSAGGGGSMGALPPRKLLIGLRGWTSIELVHLPSWTIRR